MTPAFRRACLGTLSLVLALSLGACASSKKSSPAAEDRSADTVAQDSDSGRAMGLQTIPFAYDSDLLDSNAKRLLTENARILKQHPAMKVQIEGHCDERGGIQYNLALGERRARMARSYLISQGVSAKRMETLSYGKERPLDSSGSESAHARNRRANFVILTK